MNVWDVKTLVMEVCNLHLSKTGMTINRSEL